jgi:hypothetical protein
VSSDPSIGPLTHTVSYAGQRFKVAHGQAVGIAKAMNEARLGLTSFIGLPATDADTGRTDGRYMLVGPGTPVLIEGPVIPEVGV